MRFLNLLLLASGILIGHQQYGVDAANVAMFCLMGSKSMKQIYYGVADALTSRGHNVTFYSTFKPYRQVKGLTEIYLEGHELGEMIIFDEKGLKDQRDINKNFFDVINAACHKFYTQSDEIKTLIQSTENMYDVALYDILYFDCMLPVVDHTAKHVVKVSTSELFAELKWPFDIPNPVSTIPHYSYDVPRPEMTFLERLHNVGATALMVYLFEFKMADDHERIAKLHAPQLASIEEARARIPLVLANGHTVLGDAAPTIPAVVQIGGIHIDEKEKVPKNIEDFIAGSGNAGFIYVSLGSFVPEDKMPSWAMRAFVDAFAQIPQRVVWKFRGRIPDLPANVLLVAWAPQQGILAHPKIRAFLTHGGHHSHMESVNFGVPAVGLPVYGDQPMNVQKMVRNGMAIRLSWNGLNAEKLAGALKAVVNDKSYKENAVRMQSIFRDRLVPPKEEAAYWIEYVVRHGGSTHLRVKTQHLNLFQYLLIDVFAFLATLVLLIAYVTYRVAKNCCCSNKRDKSSKKNQ